MQRPHPGGLGLDDMIPDAEQQDQSIGQWDRSHNNSSCY